MRRLPPLHSLIAFEAAGRLGSFLRAADELRLTPSAISHRIKALEGWLGCSLFVRRPRSIALTADGQRYLEAVRRSLDRIDEATRALGSRPGATVRVSVAPALGAKWLAPQLPAFRDEQPAIDLQLSTATSLEPVSRGEADLGIRYGRPPWPGLAARKLRDEVLVVVCSPAYRASGRPLAALEDLRLAALLRHPLLDWDHWFAAAGIDMPPNPTGPLFDDAMMMLEAAAAGTGAALMVASLAAPYLAAGALVEPFGIRAPGMAYYAIASRENFERPEVRALVRWLQAHAR
ncbi:MAG: LysR family transcriptional regulator [Rhodocyclaceae bacterium]|nr:LysR family transcriptional regulator [Rhodocyclaceae bacterium]